MQGVVLFLHLYVGKFSDLFFNDKIFRAKIYIKFVGWAHNAGRSPSWGVVVLRWCWFDFDTPSSYILTFILSLHHPLKHLTFNT